VDSLDQALDAKITVVEEAIVRHNARLQSNSQLQDINCHSDDSKAFVIGPRTTEEMFQAVIKGDPDESVRSMGSSDLSLVFETVSWRCISNHVSF
jgi:pre-mRNA-processing factor 40